MRKYIFPHADSSLFYDNDDPQFKTARVGYLRIEGEKSVWHSRMPHLESENFRTALADALEFAERENLIETAAENEKIYVNGGRFVLENSDFLFAFRCGKKVKYCFVYDKNEVKFMAENTMKIVVVEPNKPAYIKEIDGGLKSMQSIVGGLLEPIYFLRDPHVVMVGNENAKLIGLPGNRRFLEGIVAGTFFICGDNGEDFCSLSDEQCNEYAELFKVPHKITQEEVEQDIGMMFIGF